MATPYSTYTSTQYPPQVGEAWNGQDMNSSKPYDRRISRTPSPTPSEARELRNTGMAGLIDWRAMIRPSFWLRKEWIKYYIIGAVFAAISALITIYHTEIVHALRPYTDKLHDLRLGFLIPIAILFVISFPPLFGHEIVAVLCGLVWGLGWGFAIVAAGTFLGEVGNFYAFKYLCAARGQKYEREDIRYGTLARVVREGGFRIALIARFSAIPGHFTTAVFSTCGMGIIVFSIAAFLSLPKQFATVYMGVILEQFSGETKPDLKTRITEYSIIGVTIIVTVLAMWYIMAQMTKVKPQVIYERRKRRQGKLAYGPDAAFDSTSSLTAFNPSASESTIGMDTYRGPLGDSPLEPRQTSTMPVSQGLSAPQPRRATQQSFDAYTEYGGRPQHMQYTQAPAPMPSIQEQNQNQPRLQPPPSQAPQQPQGSFNPASPQQTPTQAQFARSPPNAGSQDPELMSPPLPTPTYGAPGGQPQSFAISQGYQPQQANPYAPPQGGPQMSPQIQQGHQQGSYPFTSPQQRQQSFNSAPGSPHMQIQQQQQQQYFVPPAGPPQMSPYSTPPLGAPGSPHLANPYTTGPMSPHLNNPYASAPVSPQATGVGATAGLVPPRHIRDETDASFYTAHSGEGSDYQHSAGVGMALTAPSGGNGPNDPPLSASSAFTNPYQGYMTPPAAQDPARTFSPPPPSYHTNAR